MGEDRLVEVDTTAISRALPSNGKLGLAISIVGPEHRFSDDERKHHEAAIIATVEALAQELRTNGEDYTS